MKKKRSLNIANPYLGTLLWGARLGFYYHRNTSLLLRLLVDGEKKYTLEVIKGLKGAPSHFGRVSEQRMHVTIASDNEIFDVIAELAQKQNPSSGKSSYCIVVKDDGELEARAW
jgi:hypothetical protein